MMWEKYRCNENGEKITCIYFFERPFVSQIELFENSCVQGQRIRRVNFMCISLYQNSCSYHPCEDSAKWKCICELKFSERVCHFIWIFCYDGRNN